MHIMSLFLQVTLCRQVDCINTNTIRRRSQFLTGEKKIEKSCKNEKINARELPVKQNLFAVADPGGGDRPPSKLAIFKNC